mmetsp:Transcript_29656/g.71257  ORF Transcript_29656/g.71257 Transcript_29656/m.71257 type:complete len:216 (-) Transcript_29656:206-853(-)
MQSSFNKKTASPTTKMPAPILPHGTDPAAGAEGTHGSGILAGCGSQARTTPSLIWGGTADLLARNSCISEARSAAHPFSLSSQIPFSHPAGRDPHAFHRAWVSSAAILLLRANRSPANARIPLSTSRLDCNSVHASRIPSAPAKTNSSSVDKIRMPRSELWSPCFVRCKMSFRTILLSRSDSAPSATAALEVARSSLNSAPLHQTNDSIGPRTSW